MKLTYETAARVADRYTGAEQDFAVRTLLGRRKLTALTEDALREFLSLLRADRAFRNKLDAGNRATREARAAETARAIALGAAA